jgi:hypothetical protein
MSGAVGREEPGLIFVGVDWAEAHNDVHVQDESGKKLGGGRLPEGVAGIARFHELAARHAAEPGDVVIGIETGRGLFPAALVAAGYQVFRGEPDAGLAVPGPARCLRGEVRPR